MKGSHITMFLIGLLTGIGIQCMICEIQGHQDNLTTETYVDTIPYYKPVPKDSLVVKTIYKRLPVVKEVNFPNKPDTAIGNFPVSDSVLVEIPIEQKIYQDSTYTAYVSGYMPALDSMFVYPKTTIVTRNGKSKWNIGIQGGVGYTPKGIQPYLGIGIQLNLK